MNETFKAIVNCRALYDNNKQNTAAAKPLLAACELLKATASNLLD